MFLRPYPMLGCPSGDGRNFVLLEYLYYTAKDGTQYRGIPDSETDGASTPQEIWIKYPPFGKWWLPAVLHDCGYRCCLEVLKEDKWTRIQLQRDVIDSLFLEAMEEQGVSYIDREVIYQAVKNFGATAFGEDASQPIKL